MSVENTNDQLRMTLQYLQQIRDLNKGVNAVKVGHVLADVTGQIAPGSSQSVEKSGQAAHLDKSVYAASDRKLADLAQDATTFGTVIEQVKEMLKDLGISGKALEAQFEKLRSQAAATTNATPASAVTKVLEKPAASTTAPAAAPKPAPVAPPKPAPAPAVVSASQQPAPTTTSASSTSSSTVSAKPSAATTATRTAASTPPPAQLTPAQRAEIEKIITAALAPLGLKLQTENTHPGKVNESNLAGYYSDEKAVMLNIPKMVEHFAKERFMPYNKNGRRILYTQDGVRDGVMSSKSIRDLTKYKDVVQYVLGVVSHEVAHATQFRTTDYSGQIPRAAVELSAVQLETAVFKQLFPGREAPKQQPFGNIRAARALTAQESAKPQHKLRRQEFVSTILGGTPDFIDSMRLDQTTVTQLLSEVKSGTAGRKLTEHESANVGHLKKLLSELKAGRDPHAGRPLVVGGYTPYNGQSSPSPVASVSSKTAPLPQIPVASVSPTGYVEAKDAVPVVASVSSKTAPLSQTPVTRARRSPTVSVSADVMGNPGIVRTESQTEIIARQLAAAEQQLAALTSGSPAGARQELQAQIEKYKRQAKNVGSGERKLHRDGVFPITNNFDTINPDDIHPEIMRNLRSVLTSAGSTLTTAKDKTGPAYRRVAKLGSPEMVLRAIEHLYNQTSVNTDHGEEYLSDVADRDVQMHNLPNIIAVLTQGLARTKREGLRDPSKVTRSVSSKSAKLLSPPTGEFDPTEENTAGDFHVGERQHNNINFITKTKSDTYLGRESIRTSMGRRAKDDRVLVEGADYGRGTQVVGFNASVVFPASVGKSIEKRVKAQEKIVRQQLAEGDVVDMQVGEKTYKVPRHIAENRATMMRSVTSASEFTGLTRMGNDRGPIGALEGNQSEGLLAGLHLGKMFESIVGTGGIPKDLTERFLQSTSHQESHPSLLLDGVKPEQQVNNARLFAQRHKEQLAYQQGLREQEYAATAGHAPTKNLVAEMTDLAMQQQLIDELMTTPANADEEKKQAIRRGQILYPKQHQQNLKTPNAHNIPSLSSDESLALMYGHEIAGVAPYAGSFMNIREQALPVQRLIESTGGTTAVARRYDQYSPVARMIQAAQTNDTDEILRLEKASPPEDYQDELNKSGTNRSKKIDGRYADVAHTSGMVEKDLSYTVNEMFGLSAQKNHNIFNALHYAGKVADSEGKLLQPDQIHQVLGGRTSHGLESIHRGAQDLQDISRTGIPIVEYAKLATMSVPDTERDAHEERLRSIHRVSPALGELSTEQLQSLSRVDYAQGGQQAITQVIKIVGASIQKKLAEAIRHKAKAAKLSSADTEDLFAQNAAGRVPQGYESLFREHNLFNPATIESNPEFLRAMSLLTGVHEQAQGGESLAAFSARAMGTGSQLHSVRTAVGRQAADAGLSVDASYALSASARTFTENETGKAPSALSRNAALGTSEVKRLSDELAKAKQKTASLTARHSTATGANKLRLKTLLQQAIAAQEQAQHDLNQAQITSDPSQIEQHFSVLHAIANSPTASVQEKANAQTQLAASEQIAEFSAEHPDLITKGTRFLTLEHGYAGRLQSDRLVSLQRHARLIKSAESGTPQARGRLTKFENERQERLAQLHGTDDIALEGNVTGFVGLAHGTDTRVSPRQKDLVQNTSLASFISKTKLLDRLDDDEYTAPTTGFGALEATSAELTKKHLEQILSSTPEQMKEDIKAGQQTATRRIATRSKRRAEWYASLTPQQRNYDDFLRNHERTVESKRATPEELLTARQTVRKYHGVDVSSIHPEIRFEVLTARNLRRQQAANRTFDRYDRKGISEPTYNPRPLPVPEYNERLAGLFAATRQLHQDRHALERSYIIPSNEEIAKEVQVIASNQLNEGSTGVPRQSGRDAKATRETIKRMTAEERRTHRANTRQVTADQLASAKETHAKYIDKENITQEEQQQLSSAQIILDRHAKQRMTEAYGDDTSKGIPQLFDMITSMTPHKDDNSPEAKHRRSAATTMASLIDNLTPAQIKAAANINFTQSRSRAWLGENVEGWRPVMAHLDSVQNVKRFADRRYSGLNAARRARTNTAAANLAMQDATGSLPPVYFDLETSRPRDDAGREDDSLKRTIYQASVLRGDDKKPHVLYAAATAEIANDLMIQAKQANNPTTSALERRRIVGRMMGMASTDVYGHRGERSGVGRNVVKSLVRHALSGGLVNTQESIKDQLHANFLNASQVIGHNITDFDLPVVYGGGIDKAAKEAVPDDIRLRAVDTLQLSRSISPGKHTLTDAYQRFVDSKGFTGAHDAAQDVLANRQLHRALGNRRVALSKINMAEIPKELHPYITDHAPITSLDDSRGQEFAALRGTYAALATMEDYTAKEPRGGDKTMANMEKMFPGVGTASPDQAAALKAQIQTRYLDRYRHLAVNGSYYAGHRFLQQRDQTGRPPFSYADMREKLDADPSATVSTTASTTDADPSATVSTTASTTMGGYGAGGRGRGRGGSGPTLGGTGGPGGGGGGGPTIIHINSAQIFVQNGHIAGISSGASGLSGGVPAAGIPAATATSTGSAFSYGVAGAGMGVRKTGPKDPFSGADAAGHAGGASGSGESITLGSLDGITSFSSSGGVTITNATIQLLKTDAVAVQSVGGAISVEARATKKGAEALVAGGKSLVYVKTGGDAVIGGDAVSGISGGAGGVGRSGGGRGIAGDLSLMTIHALEATRNAYDQSGGLTLGKSLYESKQDLTKHTVSAVNNLLAARNLGASAALFGPTGGMAGALPATQTAYGAVEKSLLQAGGASTIDEASAAMNTLLAAIEQLGQALLSEAVPGTEAFKENVMALSAIASKGTNQITKTAKTQQQTESLQISKMEERVQAAVTQPGVFNYGRRKFDKRAALKDFAEGFLGDQAYSLYDEKTASLSLPQLESVKDAQGRPRLKIKPKGLKTPLERANDAQLQAHVAFLNEENPENTVTFESLSKAQRAYARAQQTQNQSPFRDKMFYLTSKLRDIQFLAQGVANIPNIPQQLTQMLEMATSPALNAERTMTTARSLSLTPQTYNTALSAATGQQQRFGGSLSSNVSKITDFIPLTNAYGVDITKSLNVARKLAAFDPAQGMQGASIALKEFLSGNVSSLSRRFEINRSALSKINTGDATEMLNSLDEVLSKMGVTDKLIDDQANTMATKYDKMVGRLDIIGQDLSRRLVSAITPALESLLGSGSGIAGVTNSRTLNTLTNESLQAYGDAALSNKVTGLNSLDPFADPAKFTKDLDNVLRMANNDIAVQARRYSSGTGLVPQLAPYRMMENASEVQRFSVQHAVMRYMEEGKTKEQAYLQALRENQGDYNTSQEFLFQRNPINGLNMSAPDQYLGGLVKQAPGKLTLAGVLPKGPDLSTREAQARIFGTENTIGTMSAATPGGLDQQQLDIIGGIADRYLMLGSMGNIGGANNGQRTTKELGNYARKAGTAAYAVVQRRLDNDTVELLDEYGKTFKARLTNIDAPEHTATAGNTDIPKNDVLGRVLGMTQADYVITQADRNQYLAEAKTRGMSREKAQKMIDDHGNDRTLVKLGSQRRVLAVGDDEDRYKRELSALFVPGKNGNLIAVNRKLVELGGAPVAFSNLRETGRAAMEVLAKNAADIKLGAVNTQAAGLDLGGNAIISQKARDEYFRLHYMNFGQTLGMASLTAGAGVTGLSMAGNALISAFPGSAAATALASAGAIGTAGVFGLAGGIGLTAGLGYGAYAYGADVNDTSVAKQRELYAIQADMNRAENQRRLSMSYVYNAGMLPETTRAITAAQTQTGEEFRGQTWWEKIYAGLGSIPGREGAPGGQQYENLMPAETKQDPQIQIALDYADQISKEVENNKDKYAQRRETAPDSVKKVYDTTVINPMAPGPPEHPNYISILGLQAQMDAADAVAQSGGQIRFRTFADSAKLLRAREAIANQTNPESQVVNDLLEKNKITIPMRILKGGPEYIRNRITNDADAGSRTFKTEDILRYSADEQNIIYKYGLDQLGSLRNYSQPAKEYQDQAMTKMVGFRNQRFTQFMDANAMNAMFMGNDNTTSPTALRGTSGVKAAALNMLNQSYFMTNNANDEVQKEGVRSAQTAAVDAMLEQVRAFKEQADVARPFTTLYRTTFTNLIQGMRLTGENFQQIFDTMSQGNPMFAMDFAKQATGLDWKQSIASQLYVPGFNAGSAAYGSNMPDTNMYLPGYMASAAGYNPSTLATNILRPGLMANTVQAPYATGPRASIQYANDLLNDQKTTGMLNPAEMLGVFQSAAQGQTELVRRQIQFNNQMRDLNINHNYALEDIARNGMRQLQDIHTNYTRQMTLMTQQNEISKRMDRASVNKNIESADITQKDRVQAHVVQESGQMFARHAGQSNPQAFLEKVRGTALENDPAVQALRKATEEYNKISYDNPAAKQAAWDKVIEARNPLEAKIKQMQEGATPQDTATYGSYLGLLGRDPAREAAAQTYSNQRTSQFVESAAERKGLLRQKEDLLHQQSGEVLTRRQLQKGLETANASGDPLQIAAAKKAVQDFEINSQRTAEAIALVSQKLSAISNTAEMFADAWKEAFDGITNNASTTVLGLVQSLDDFNKTMARQIIDQDIQFGRQIKSLKQAFIDAAREIATQIPAEMAKGYTAILTYISEQSRAEALMLSGDYEGGKNKMLGNMTTLADSLYGGTQSDAAKKLLANLTKNIPVNDKSATGVELPSNGLMAALTQVEGGKWALRVTTTSAAEVPPPPPKTFNTPPPSSHEQSGLFVQERP